MKRGSFVSASTSSVRVSHAVGAFVPLPHRSEKGGTRRLHKSHDDTTRDHGQCTCQAGSRSLGVASPVAFERVRAQLSGCSAPLSNTQWD